MKEQYDAIVIGAGAAGMMCAGVAAQRGRRVLLLDHASQLAEKIRISGGGRCNFTNLHAGPTNYLSSNPHFCKSALARYTPQDFLALVRKHRIAFHEKHKGQLFCDDSSEEIIAMLKAECDAGGVHWRLGCGVQSIQRAAHGFVVQTAVGELTTANVVLATGGLSIPKIGASDFAYRVARQFDLPLVEPRPGLVPLTFSAASWQPFSDLAGIALEVEIAVGEKKQRTRFREDLLFTHRGLSGPAVLQISSFWRPGQALSIDLLPEHDLETELQEQKNSIRKQLANHLAQYLPVRLVEGVLRAAAVSGEAKVPELSDKALRKVAQVVHDWQIVPDGSEGYRKAEVTCGGIDTRALNQQSMMVQSVPGLYVVGEAMDVTGWLGGYNFQWAWASGVAAGKAL